MKIINYLKLFLFALGTLILFMNASVCECGDYNTGTTTYLVNSRADCCEITALAPGYPGLTNSWLQQGNGVWQIDNTTFMSSSEAQTKCCN